MLLLPNLSILELQHNPLKTLPPGLQGVIGPHNRLDLSHAGLEGSAGQKWTVQMAEPDGAVADLPRSLAPRGGRFDFGLGAGTVDDYEDRKLRMVRLADDRLSLVSRLRPGLPDVILDPPPPPIHGRFDHVRLTSLAGTTCDSQSRFQDLSGLWFNPERSGEGFVLEVLADDRAVVYWFTYRPDATGRPVWMIGTGQLESSSIGTPPPDAAAYWVAFDAMIQPGGTVSGPGFDPSAIELVDWGKLHLDFHRQGTARASWESQLDGYGSGSYPLERLARPMLADCQDTSVPRAIDATVEDSASPTTYKGLPLALTDNAAPEVTASDGLVGMVCIGMSNAHQECRRLIRGMAEVWTEQIDSSVRLVNCALGGHAIERWNDPDFDDVLWDDCADKVAAAGLSRDQIRVVLHKAANQFTTSPDGSPLLFYPDPDSDFYNFYQNLDIFAGRVTAFFPGLQAVFTTSRSYGGFAEREARGEPLSYEQGHALNQWLHDNPSVDNVWFGWGPYIWAPDCITGATNGAGICYERSDFQADGIHPSPAGEIKIATLWHDKLRLQPWYAR